MADILNLNQSEAVLLTNFGNQQTTVSKQKWTLSKTLTVGGIIQHLKDRKCNEPSKPIRIKKIQSFNKAFSFFIKERYTGTCGQDPMNLLGTMILWCYTELWHNQHQLHGKKCNITITLQLHYHYPKPAPNIQKCTWRNSR
jgi:hypothetical protein